MTYDKKTFFTGLEGDSKPQIMTVDEALAYGENNLSEEAYILAESPREVIHGKLAEKKNKLRPKEITSLYIFDGVCELRLEKEYGKEKGACRILREKQGEEYLARASSYRLVGGKGWLAYREYFVRDAKSGMFVPFAARFCGVAQQER